MPAAAVILYSCTFTMAFHRKVFYEVITFNPQNYSPYGKRIDISVQ